METREPDIIGELRRGNMKEKWGVQLLHRIYNGRLELCVKKGKEGLLFYKVQFNLRFNLAILICRQSTGIPTTHLS